MSNSGLTTSEKAKKFLTKKMLLGVTALIVGVAIIFVSSIVPLMIDPSQWNNAGFISDEIINVALTILGEVCLIMIGQAYNQATDISNLAKARVEFDKSVEENVGDKITGFDQWIKQVLEPRDQHSRYTRLLHYLSIENEKYLDLGRSDLKRLLKDPNKIDGIFFRQLNKKQYKLILEILDGKEVINFVDPSTWRKLSKIDTDKTPSEKLANQQKKKSSTVLWSVLTKSMLVVGCGLIFGALIPTGGTQSIGETLMKLFTRLFCFSSAGFMGFFVGCQMNDIDAEYILEKIDVQRQYHSDINFKPLSEQELAKKEFESRVKRENEEYMKLQDNSNKLEMKV